MISRTRRNLEIKVACGDLSAVRAAAEVVRQGINMTIYVEGKRSFDGKLLPFKKGPFYLAMECALPVVPVRIVGTHEAMPKGRFSITPGLVRVTFHDPIDPGQFTERDALMQAVRRSIDSGLPPQCREGVAASAPAAGP